MKITRVVCTLDDICRAPGVIIEKSLIPDRTVIQHKSEEIFFGKGIIRQKEWLMISKDIIRYVIEGQAKIVSKRTIDGERTFVENAENRCIGKTYEGSLKFAISSGERILGLGQHEEGIHNYRNVTQYLYQNNMKIPMPVLVSTAGYAVILDANCLMTYEEQGNEVTIHFDAVDQIAYYLIESDSIKELVQGIRKVTGKAPLLPLWAYGYVQSRERYCTQEELVQVASEFGKREIPVSCLVQDWSTWERGKWGDKHVDKKRYPDLKAAVTALHDSGIAFMFSVWPNPGKGSPDNQEMLEAGKLYANLSTYDAFDEEAREIYWKQCQREIFAAGTDAWWCDSTEPFTPDWNGSEKRSALERYELAKEALTKYMDAREANAYALYHAMGIYDNQKKTDFSRRVVNLTRSGYLSIQKYGAILWSGDIMATWEVFRQQIVEGLQMSVSGIPYWTLDIGAFFCGNYNAWKRWSGAKEGKQPWFWNGLFEDGTADKGYCELYVRWLQYGTFLPIMRSHGTDTPREPWFFGEEGTIYYDTIVKYIHLRYRLLPYIYSLAYQVYAEDAMMMRPLVCDYTCDERAAEIKDQFLFGDFLVCPVTEPMEFGPGNTLLNHAAQRQVYLPGGEVWYDYETGDCVSDGAEAKELVVCAPIDKMPLYIKGGSILAVNDKIRANLYEKQRLDRITFEIYGGRDGSFSYYLDKGNGYEYQSGEYALIPVSWKDDEGVFCMGVVEGDYDYPRQCRILVYGIDGQTWEKEIAYEGTYMEVKCEKVY